MAPPALDLDRMELACLDELGDARTDLGEVETEVVAQVTLRGDAEGGRGDADELALGILR